MVTKFYKMTGPGNRQFFGDNFEMKQHLWSLLNHGVALEELKLEESLRRGSYKDGEDDLDQLVYACEMLKRG